MALQIQQQQVQQTCCNNLPASLPSAKHQSASTANFLFLPSFSEAAAHIGKKNHCRALKQPIRRSLVFFADLHLGKELIFFFLPPPAAGGRAGMSRRWLLGVNVRVGETGTPYWRKAVPALAARPHCLHLRVCTLHVVSVPVSYSHCLLSHSPDPPPNPHPTFPPGPHPTARPCPTPRLSLLPLCRLCAWRWDCHGLLWSFVAWGTKRVKAIRR